MSSSDIKKNMERMYAGDPVNDECIGLVPAHLRYSWPLDQFAGLYNVEDMTTVTSSASARGIADSSLCWSGSVLVMKPELILVGGNSGGLTVSMILAASLADKKEK